MPNRMAAQDFPEYLRKASKKWNFQFGFIISRVTEISKFLLSFLGSAGGDPPLLCWSGGCALQDGITGFPRISAEGFQKMELPTWI